MDQQDVLAGELGEFIRKTAHDIRTPLTSISGFAELLSEDETLSRGARENAATILDEARRLSEILETLFAELTGEEIGAVDED